MIALAIPFSIISAVGFLYLSGQTLDVFTMLGLMLATGMLVDNAVVVLESIYQKLEMGMDRVNAAKVGTQEVITAVIAATLTSVIIFVPLIFGEQNDFLLVEYERRVAAHPTDFKLKAEFGELLLQNERYDEAIAQFQNARKDPKYAVLCHAKIGKSFFAKGLYDLAIREFGNALDGIKDRDTGLWKGVQYDLAHTHAAKGNTENALELYEEIMSIDINYSDVSQQVDQLRNG